MSLKDDLHMLAAQSLESLNNAHNYFTHSRAMWRITHQQIKAEGRTFTIENRVTGHKVDEKDIAKLTQPYIVAFLAKLTFQLFVSLFEDFLFEVIRLWLNRFPQSLSKRKLDFQLVLDSPDKAAMTQAMVEREINQWKYERVELWFERLQELVRLGCPTADEVAAITEIKAPRDILAHNQGIANFVYVSKAGKRARYKPGELLNIPLVYHRDSWRLITKVVGDISQAAIQKAPAA